MMLADLIIRIKADVAGAEAGFLKTKMGMEDIEKSTTGANGLLARHQKLLTGAGIAGGVVLGALALGADKALNSYDAYGEGIEKLSQVTGMSAHQASLLTAQNMLLTGSQSVGAMAVKTFASALGKAQEGGAAQIKMFQQLGVSLKDSSGHYRDVGAVMQDTRTKLSQMTNGAQRAEAMTTLFGRGAVQLSKWLTAPQSEIDKLSAKAKAMGAVLDEQRLNQIKKYQLAQNELKGAVALLGMQFAQALLPIVTKLTQGLTLLVGIFAKVPGPIKDAAAVMVVLVASTLLFMGVAAKLLQWYGTIRTAIARRTEAMTAEKVATTQGTVATEANTVADVENNSVTEIGIAKTELSAEARASATEATVAETGATEANTAAMSASIGVMGLVGAGIAADIVLITKAVQAYQQMRAAIEQANAARMQAASNLGAAQQTNPAAFATNNPALKSNQSAAQIQGSIQKDAYKGSWYNPFTWASGVDAVFDKPTHAVFGEAGAERVTVQPVGSAKPGKGHTFNFSIENVNGTDRDAAQRLLEQVKVGFMNDIIPLLQGGN